jgi:hypothetical protein
MHLNLRKPIIIGVVQKISIIKRPMARIESRKSNAISLLLRDLKI